MKQPSNPLERLTELAQEKSSDRRRELLREVTDLFFQSDQPHSGSVSGHFDTILSTITEEMDVAFRREIANRFANTNNAPVRLAQQLAKDDFNVAEPVLRHSPVLSDVDLTNIVDDNSQDHIRAISTRSEISEHVTGAIVAKGDTQTLVTLTQNQGARFSRNTMQVLVDKSESQTELQSPLVNHKDLPPDMLNEMYFFVEERLRQRIIERNDNTPPEELERAFKLARSQICSAMDLPSDFKEAQQFIEAKKLRKHLTPTLLAELVCNKQYTHFYLAFAEMTELDFETAQRVWEPDKTEAVAIVCKASNLPRDLFATLVVLFSKDGAKDISAIKTLGQIYDGIPNNTAERTMRFWKMRKHTQHSKAA